MTDHHHDHDGRQSPLGQSHQGAPNLVIQRPSSSGSYDTRGGSSVGSGDFSAPPTSRQGHDRDMSPTLVGTSPGAKPMRPSPRSHRNRASAAFLLQELVGGTNPAAAVDGTSPHKNVHQAHEPSQRRKLSSRFSLKGKGLSSRAARDRGSAPTPGNDAGPSPSPDAPGSVIGDMREEDDEEEEEQAAAAAAPTPAPTTAMGNLNVDSAEIVNMALNLSESRRLAAHRSPQSAIPPRLAPTPDSSPAGPSLRQQIQQQRRTPSMTLQRVDRRPHTAPRVSSPLSPLQALAGGGGLAIPTTGAYRYTFSPSTRARAQKAKDYIELLTHYWRLMDVMPPITPRPRSIASAAAAATSPPASPVHSRAPNFWQTDSPVQFGRRYNPLQFIRNRKVRARERMSIDGDGQGFADPSAVSSWVDEVVASAEHRRRMGEPDALPPFPGSRSLASQPSAPSNRPKRPRVDWFFEPADLLADAYWLAQGDNKRLIEDRHLRRIFAAEHGQSQPEHDGGGSGSASPKLHRKESYDDSFKLLKTDTEHSHNSARERARQKLHEIKDGFHHRHSSSHSHHDFIRSIGGGSASDGSDDDHQAQKKQRRHRTGTFTASSKEILEKQMKEMMVEEKEALQAAEHKKVETSTQQTPARPPRFHGRIGSFTSVSESDEAPSKSLALRPTRSSLEVPSRRSIEYDSSAPNTPELRPVGDGFTLNWMDTSPESSRPGSPSRNPLSKVKSIFRDRSRERGEGQDKDKEGSAETEPSLTAPSTELMQVVGKRPSTERMHSPIRKLPSRNGADTSRSARGISLRQKGEGIFKGARNGIYKATELLWRKDAAISEGPSSDESDADQARGRSRLVSRRRRGSSYEQEATADSMAATGDGLSPRSPGGTLGLLPPALSRTSSRQSIRTEQLDVPRIDVRSPSLTPPVGRSHRLGDSDLSEVESVYAPSHADARERPPGSMPGQRLLLKSNWNKLLESTQRTSPASCVPCVTRREIAWSRALMLRSGIMALQVTHHAQQRRPLDDTAAAAAAAPCSAAMTWPKIGGIPWSEISELSLNPSAITKRGSVVATDVFPLAAQALTLSIQESSQRLQTGMDRFAERTVPQLHQRLDAEMGKITADLSVLAREAADQADDTSRDIATLHRLQVKAAVDTIEGMLRRKRRRFRWVRRAMWVAVEWALVGFMWYVWFIVMIFRIVTGVGTGVVRGVKWLLWL